MLVNRNRVKEVMKRNGVDVLVASMPENVTYLTDFWSLSHWLLKGTQTYAVIPADEKIAPYIVASMSDLDMAADQEDCWIRDFVSFGKFFIEIPPEPVPTPTEKRLRDLLSRPPKKADALSALVESLDERNLVKGRMALDELNIPFPLAESIREKLSGLEIVPGYSMLREIRAVKTPEEVARLERAVDITEKAFFRALSFIREGASEAEIAHVYNTAVAEQDALPVLTCIGAGPRSALPNVAPSAGYRVKRGDLIRFDVGCLYRNYYADTARIAVLGRPSSKQQDYYQAVVEGEELAIARIRPGVRAPEIFETAVQGVRRAGIPHYQRSHVGHGIGIECYDPPFLNPSSPHVLEEGMVLNVETPYYELGFGGVQIEDTLMVTTNGCRPLTKSGKELFVV
jgi:Xaa-Pro aminopeptidase